MKMNNLDAHIGEAKLPFSREKVLLIVSKNKLVHKKCCDIDLLYMGVARFGLWAPDITFFHNVVSEGIRRDKRRGENLTLRL